MEMGGQPHALSALLPDKQTLIATEKRLGGPQVSNHDSLVILSVGMAGGTHGR